MIPLREDLLLSMVARLINVDFLVGCESTGEVGD